MKTAGVYFIPVILIIVLAVSLTGLDYETPMIAAFSFEGALGAVILIVLNQGRKKGDMS